MSIFTEPVRRPVPLTFLVYGPTGSGKTHAAILIGSVLGGGPPAVINTEPKGTQAQIGKQDFRELLRPPLDANGKPNYTLDRLSDDIGSAIKDGFPAVVVDTISRYWEGPGGVQDQKDDYDASHRGASGKTNTFANWRFIKPSEERLNEMVAFSEQAHIIYTAQATPWRKQDPKTMEVYDYGIKPRMRERWLEPIDQAIELESRTHNATWEKNRFGFPDFKGPITPASLEAIRAWASTEGATQQRAATRGASEMRFGVVAMKVREDKHDTVAYCENEIVILPGCAGLDTPCRLQADAKPLIEGGNPVHLAHAGKPKPVYVAATWKVQGAGHEEV